jgi:deazaflavin-dependent oxidoreductase (nitroreductase family)
MLSGGFMVWAGYVLATGSVATALWITLPSWVAIEVAFSLIRRADRAAGWSQASRSVRVREEGGILVAGLVMMLAGYAGGAWSWLLAGPLVVIGGLTVAAAVLAGHDPGHKRRLVRAVEKYVANPPTKAALRLGLPMPLVLLETTGRQTGKARRTPVMNGVIGDELWIVAEHGRRAAYVRNLIANPRVRVKSGRQWREGRAEVLDEDEPFARVGWIAERLGRSKKAELVVTRVFCVDPVTVRVDLSHAAPVVHESPSRDVKHQQVT